MSFAQIRLPYSDGMLAMAVSDPFRTLLLEPEREESLKPQTLGLPSSVPEVTSNGPVCRFQEGTNP